MNPSGNSAKAAEAAADSAPASAASGTDAAPLAGTLSAGSRSCYTADMAKRVFVGNLPFATTNEQLRELFERFGPCDSATVVADRVSGRSRGFGFVEMQSDDDAAR